MLLQRRTDYFHFALAYSAKAVFLCCNIVIVLVSLFLTCKVAQFSSTFGMYILDFGGRVKLASVYNFILLPPEAQNQHQERKLLSTDKDEEVAAAVTESNGETTDGKEQKEEQDSKLEQATSYPLLVGHSSPERIACDYSWPLGSIQALGIAIAVIDGRKGSTNKQTVLLH